MKASLLDVLRCLECKNKSFSLEKHEDDGMEIRKGRLKCNHCGAMYGIEDGIIDFLNNAEEAVRRERKAMDDD